MRVWQLLFNIMRHKQKMLGTEVIRFAHNEDIFVQFAVFEKHLPVFILMV